MIPTKSGWDGKGKGLTDRPGKKVSRETDTDQKKKEKKSQIGGGGMEKSVAVGGRSPFSSD